MRELVAPLLVDELLQALLAGDWEELWELVREDLEISRRLSVLVGHAPRPRLAS